MDDDEQLLRPEVQAHIDALDEPHRRLFDRLHQLIVAEVPGAEIVISYQIPIYKARTGHVGLNTWRADGITLTATSPDHIEQFHQRHPQFKVHKASIQFGFDDELPDDDIREVVRRATSG